MTIGTKQMTGRSVSRCNASAAGGASKATHEFNVNNNEQTYKLGVMIPNAVKARFFPFYKHQVVTDVFSEFSRLL